MERVILVDEADNEIGAAEKIAAHRDNRLHRAFSVFIRRGDEMLLQRRALGKYHSGGLWANACCGHPRPGEALRLAAMRRLGEEMGFSCPLIWRASTRYQCALDGGMSENELVHLFFGDYDGPVEPDPAEVMEWRWWDFESVRRAAREGGEFVYWLRDYVRKGLV